MLSSSAGSYLIKCKIQTCKRLKRMLFIMTKHSMWIFRVSHFFADYKQHLNCCSPRDITDISWLNRRHLLTPDATSWTLFNASFSPVAWFYYLRWALPAHEHIYDLVLISKPQVTGVQEKQNLTFCAFSVVCFVGSSLSFIPLLRVCWQDHGQAWCHCYVFIVIGQLFFVTLFQIQGR